MRETVEAESALFWDFLEVGLEDFGLVDLEDVFQNVVEKIGVGKRNAEKRGEVAERHEGGVVAAAEGERIGRREDRPTMMTGVKDKRQQRFFHARNGLCWKKTPDWRGDRR